MSSLISNQLVKNLFSNYLGNAIGMVLGFLLVPFLIRQMGAEGFGITVVAESLILLFQVFVSAVRISVARYTTVSLARGDQKTCLDYLSTGKRFLFILTSLSVAMGGIMVTCFPIFFNIPVPLHHQSCVMLLLIMAGFVLSIPNVIYWAVIYGHQRSDMINTINGGGLVLRAALIFVTFAVFPYGNGKYLLLYGLIYFLVTVTQNTIIRHWAKKMFPLISKVSWAYDRTKGRELFWYTRYTVLATISGVLYDQVMPLIINITCGPAANAMYAVASRIPTVLKRFFLEPSWSLIPTFTHLASKEDKVSVEKLFFIYSKGVAAVFIPITFVGAACSRVVIHLWVGRSFEPAIPVMVTLMLTAICSIYTYLCVIVTEAYGQIKLPTLVGIAGAVGSILLASLLAFHFKMGLQGVANAVLMVTILTSFFFGPLFTCNILKVNVFQYWLKSFIYPLLLTGLFFGWVWFFPPATSTLVNFSLTVLVTLVSYTCFIYRWVFHADERAAMLSLVKKEKFL